MSKRYASVDRTKEIKAKREINYPYPRRNLVLNVNNFDINNFFHQTKQNALRTLNSNRYRPKKLPLINKQITTSNLGDINNSKTTEISSDMNNAFSFDRENNEKNNLKTEVNIDNNSDNYYKIVINSDFKKRSTMNKPNLSSGKKRIKPKIEFKKEINENIIKMKYPPILRSERLYPKINKDKNSINVLKTIKTIRNNQRLPGKMKSYNDYIAYDSKFENIVFDANKVLKKHNFKENDLKVNDNINTFVSQNKELGLNNLFIKLIKQENKNLKENTESRNKEIEKFKTIIEKDEKDFDSCINKQKNLYYQTNDLLNQIHIKNYNLIKIFYELKSKSKTLEDEIFKMIENIETLRLYAKFVTKVLGGNDKFFEGELIPDYENSIKPDIHILIKRVYDKYGNLLKKHKLSITSNTFYTINNKEKNKNNNEEINTQDETIEQVDLDLLNDPLLMVRKFKELQERILYSVGKIEAFEKNANIEYENNEQIIKDLKYRINILQKELEYSQINLDDFKNILNQNNFKNTENQEFYRLIKDLSMNIFDMWNKDNYTKKEQKIKIQNIDLFELNDDVSKCIHLLIEKEELINNYISTLETYETTEKKLFSEIMNGYKNELKFMNQNKNKENINIGDNKKNYKIFEKFNKIIIKSRKCEPPYYKMKKEVVIKEDPNDIINRENTELITYK